jgi:hypothetical protein
MRVGGLDSIRNEYDDLVVGRHHNAIPHIGNAQMAWEITTQASPCTKSAD